MAENKKSELTTKLGELFKEIYSLVNEAKKNGAEVGVVACFSNEVEDGIEGSTMMSGSEDNCSLALSEIVIREPKLVKRAAAVALVKQALGLKRDEEETEGENNDSNDKFAKAADEIANIIKGLKED